jgi:hypothetical protein
VLLYTWRNVFEVLDGCETFGGTTWTTTLNF